jgi:hypothetical protein
MTASTTSFSTDLSRAGLWCAVAQDNPVPRAKRKRGRNIAVYLETLDN